MQHSNNLGKNLWLPDLGELFGVVTLVSLCTFSACALAQVAGHIVVIWPADGLLLGVLLTTPRSTWPSYILSGFAANTAGALLAGYSGEMSLKVALTNSFEIMAVIATAHYYFAAKLDLSQPLSSWRFALVGSILISPLVTALALKLGVLFIDGLTAPILIGSFLAHTLGIITVTPLVLTIRHGEFYQLVNARQLIKTLCVFTLLLSTMVLVFGQSRYPLLFMVFPPLVLAVTFCGFPGGALSIFLATFLSIGFTVGGNGPTMLIPNVTLLEQLLSMQMFLTVAAIMVLVLSVLLAERDRAEHQLRNAKDDLAQLATTDGLTGLANRRHMNEVLEQECRRAARDQTNLSFLLLDVDHFKSFNDKYGHQAGDECLRAIATVFKSFGRRPGDLSARYGGEELALILPATDEAGAMKTAEDVRAAIEALQLPHAGNSVCGCVVTASIGIATARHNNALYNPEALIRAADELLYEAKRTGRNKVFSHTTQPSDPVPPPLHDEELRVAMVDHYHRAQSAPQSEELDRIARIAAGMLNTPIALVSLVGRDEQVFVGRYGLDAKRTGRDVSFCAHVITGDSPMVVPNALEDPRFKNNAFVTDGLNIRFYAGAPLISSEGQLHLGALCVMDQKSRPMLSDYQKTQLADLARVAMTCIEQEIATSSSAAA